MINKWNVYQNETPEKRLDRIRTWCNMRYGRKLSDVCDEMEFLISEIERLTKEQAMSKPQEGDMPELLPCPFCGSPAKSWAGVLGGSSYAGCTHGGCGALTPIAHAGYSERAWNTRASPPPQPKDELDIPQELIAGCKEAKTIRDQADRIAHLEKKLEDAHARIQVYVGAQKQPTAQGDGARALEDLQRVDVAGATSGDFATWFKVHEKTIKAALHPAPVGADEVMRVVGASHFQWASDEINYLAEAVNAIMHVFNITKKG
jgi:hypothetical protein